MILLCLGFCTTHGQEPYYLPFGTADGLPSNVIYNVVQDSKGYMWIAHEEGLSRYDGYHIKTFSSEKQSYRAGSNINEDALGRIWYETFDGYLYYVEGDSMHRLPSQLKPMGYILYGLMDSTLAVVSKDTITLYNINTLKPFKYLREPVSLYSGSVTTGEYYYLSFGENAIRVDRKGDVERFATLKGAVLLEEGGRIFTADRGDYEEWIYELKNGKSERVFHTPGVRFMQGIFYVNNKYWICTPEGIWVYDNDGNILNNNKPLFAGKNISGLWYDREGNYWFCTLNEGILFVPDLSARITFTNGDVPSRITTDSHHTYIATNKCKVYSYNSKESHVLNLLYKDEVPHQVNSLEVDTVNNRFLICSQMFKVFDQNFRQLYLNPMPVKQAIVIDSRYYAYSATGRAGLARLSDKGTSKWDAIFEQHKSPYNNIDATLLTGARFKSVLYNAVDEALYFSGSSGLFRFDKQHSDGVEIKQNGEPLSVSELCLYNGELVVITSNNTLLFVNNKNEVRRVNTGVDVQLYKSYLVNDKLYVLTGKGVQSYNADKDELGNSDLLRGIRCEEIYDIHQQGDRLLVATTQGIVTVPADDEYKQAEPLFYITHVVVNDTGMLKGDVINLGYHDNNIEIHYSSPAYRSAAQYPILYKINNGEWVPTSTSVRSLKLASLSPGDYAITFAHDTGKGGIKEASVLNLTIARPFWLTIWFWAMMMIVVSSLVYTYYKWQTGLLKKQNILLTEKVALERNLHKSVLMSIRSQMNPHFFYNALNTIQSYIISDDKRNAAAYLSKFSKLTRTILEMTGKETVTLAEEINALKLYLDLEKVRFNNEMNYCVNVVNGLETDVVKIPSMIVQPYIENSIKHGLLHKNGEKLLRVDFLRKEDNLCIIIDDNGIGRKKSGELNKIRADKHTPFATEANMKRIEILNQGNNNIGVVYTDKVDAFGHSNGTIVTITIPLIKA